VTSPGPAAVPVSVGVGVSTVAAMVGPVMATAGPTGDRLAAQSTAGVESVRSSMKTALSTALSP
jgi:hypothetical protein